MLEGRDIICFSSDWGGHIDSSHHLVRRFMKANRVLWVNSIGIRPPRFSGYDFRRAWKKIFRRNQSLADVPPGPTAIYTPRMLPFFGSKLAKGLTRRAVTRGLGRLMEELDFRQVILWACVPTVSLVAEALAPALVVNYVMDDCTLLAGVNTKAILDLERRLFEQSDLILVTADHLKKIKLQYGKPISVLPHGADFDHFHGPRRTPPEEMASLRHPVVGFFGIVGNWVDIELMKAVAKANPEMSFVFIGDLRTELLGLDGLDNVFLLGEKPYEVLPDYARHFDVSVNPFRITEMTRSVNPLKLIEYFALGTPVVSTRLPSVEPYAAHLRLVDTAEEFSEAIRAALAEDSEEARAARLDLARANSWESRAETASELIEAALAGEQG